MCVLLSLQVCFDSAMKHENGVSDTIGSLQVVKFYSFMKEIKLCTYALLHIVFGYVKSENNSFKKILKKRSSPCLHSLVKTSAKFVRILPNVFFGFHQAIKAPRKC